MTAILATILAIATSFIITFLVIPVIIKYSRKKKKMMDTPGRRKIHKKITPSLGGIGIFLGFFTALVIFWLPFEGFNDYKFVVAALTIIFVVGLRDDIIPLRPAYKLVGQIIAASLVILLSGIRLNSFYGIFGVHELGDVWSYLITMFTIVVITNSFNLIDGLDGLAGTISTIALTFFGVWFYLVGEQTTALLALAMVGAIIAFLTFNWEPSKIFMGDTGALLIGFLFSILAINFIDFNHNLPSGSVYKFEASVTTAIGVIIIPLFDTLRIFIIRISKKQSPFAPDKSHMHHVLMRLGMTHSQTAISLGGLNLIYIAAAFILKDINDFILLPSMLIFSVVLSIVLDLLILNKMNRS